MSQPNGTLDHEGQTIAHRIGPVLVMLTCVRPAVSYRVAVCYGATGAEIPELTGNYADEATARRAARNACTAFAGGATITQVLDRLAGAAQSPAAAAGIVLVERRRLARETGPAGLSRITRAQYRLLAACLAAGTDEIARGDGEASVTTLRALAQFGAASLVLDRDGEVIGARLTGFGWRVLAAESARRAGKPTPQLIPVPVAALASAGLGPQLRLVAA